MRESKTLSAKITEIAFPSAESEIHQTSVSRFNKQMNTAFEYAASSVKTYQIFQN